MTHDELTFKTAIKSSSNELGSSESTASEMKLNLHLAFNDAGTHTVAQHFDQKLDAEFDIPKLLGTCIPRRQKRSEHRAPLFSTISLRYPLEKTKGWVSW